MNEKESEAQEKKKSKENEEKRHVEKLGSGRCTDLAREPLWSTGLVVFSSARDSVLFVSLLLSSRSFLCPKVTEEERKKKKKKT